MVLCDRLSWWAANTDETLAKAIVGFSSVAPYQNLMSAGICAWGVFAVFGTEPPTTVAEMTPGIYAAWVLIHLTAPLVRWAGQLLPASRPRPKWWLQWAGDSAICVMLVTYLLVMWELAQSSAADATYLVNVFVVLTVCAFLLSVRDVLCIIYFENLCRRQRHTDQARAWQ